MSYHKSPDTRTGKGPPSLYLDFFCQCGVFVHILDFYDSLHNSYICDVFAGKLFISLVSEVFMECS